MLWKNINNCLLISVSKIICGIKINNKFRSILVPKRISKLNLFIRLCIKLSYYVLGICNPERISLFFILSGLDKMILKIRDKWKRNNNLLNKKVLKITIICSSVLNIKTKANFHLICSFSKGSVNYLILNIVS